MTDARAVRERIKERERKKVEEIAAQAEEEEAISVFKPKKSMGFDLLMMDEESEDDNYEEEIYAENAESDKEEVEPQENKVITKEKEPETNEEEVATEEEAPAPVETFEVGEQVLRDDQVCIVTKIDYETDPPAYVVHIKGTNRSVNTEASRLQKYVKKKRKRKRKKKKKKNNSQPVEDKKWDGTPEDSDAAISRRDERREKLDKVFDLISCDLKFINADAEMVRRFGKGIVEENERIARKRRHQRYQLHRKTSIAKPKPEWPPLRVAGKGGGLYMSVLEEVGEIKTFRLHFNDEYARQQEEFRARASTMDPHIVAQLLQVNHFHVDTLLTMSEMLTRSNQNAEANDFIERALFRVECAFHGKFDITTGRCRLPFVIMENQMVFVALRKHIYHIGRRGCWRAAMECCKLLLSLDPETDPMFALLQLDYWAIQARQYQYVIDFASFFTFQGCCMMLYPNFCYSVAVAKKFLDKKAPMVSSDPVPHDLHDVRELSPSISLQQAILLFPEMIGPLLKKCKPEWLSKPEWKEVLRHNYFVDAKIRRQDNSTLRKLVDAYIERTHSIWENHSHLQWVLQNCQKVIERLDNSEDSSPDIFAALRDSVYDSALPSRFRTLDVTEFSDTIQLLPPDDRPQIPFMVEQPAPNMFEGQHPAQAFLTSLLPWMHTNDVAGPQLDMPQQQPPADRDDAFDDI